MKQPQRSSPTEKAYAHYQNVSLTTEDRKEPTANTLQLLLPVTLTTTTKLLAAIETILQGRNLLSGVPNSLYPGRSKPLQSLGIIRQLLPVTVHDHKPKLLAAPGIAWKRDTGFRQ
jgi:hypothetical protein